MTPASCRSTTQRWYLSARHGEAVPGADRSREVGIRRGKRAGPARVVGAGGGIGHVEVEEQRRVLRVAAQTGSQIGSQIRSLGRVQQIAAGAVRLATSRCVTER